MFNQKASDQERNKTLKEFIKKTHLNGHNFIHKDGVDSDSQNTYEEEFLTDEQLNEMIARNDKEFELFK